MCEFKIKADILTKILKLCQTVIQQFDESISMIIKVKNNKALFQIGSFGSWLEQIAEVESIKDGQCSIFPFSLCHLKYSKVVYFAITNNTVSIESGSLKADLEIVSTVEKAIKDAPKEKIGLRYKFEKKSFCLALTSLNFNPIVNESIKTAIRILKEGDKIKFITNDEYRGGYFEIDDVHNHKNNFDITIDFSNQLSILPFLSGEDIKLGISDNLIRLQSKNIDFHTPLQSGKVQDVVGSIANFINKDSQSSFCIDTKNFRDSIKSVCSLIKSKEETALTITLKSGNRVKNKPIIDTMTISTKVGRNKLKISTNIETLKNDITFSTSRKVTNDAIIIDGMVKISIYTQIILIESLNHTLKYIIPRIND